MLLPRNYHPVVYFCSEFAIDSDLPTYAGGLGILAGDTLNAAADDNFPLIGVGILYKGKQFIQHITADGKEEKRDSQFDHDSSFLRPVMKKGQPLVFSLPSLQGEIKVKSYVLRLSENTIQFFLSSDVDGNPDDWINDMNTLYRGDLSSQFRQQFLLGVGGYRLMKELGIKPSVLHINEGRPAFVVWEKGDEKVIYTNHTLLPAANIDYDMQNLRELVRPYAQETGKNVDELIMPGKVGENGFSTNMFAMRVADVHSGVSKLHTSLLSKRHPSFKWKSITNGVHMNRWQDSDFRNPNISNNELWELHRAKKRELMEAVIERTGFGYDPDRLVISWARRLAEYKQPMAIFRDVERLKSILTVPGKEVQILLAGNSHAADPNGKSIIEKIISILSNDLAGHAIFVPNYNMALANKLVSGSDVWLNTPQGKLEACGTSGMKAAANGVINCTVLDGWTYEVEWDNKGFVLDPGNVSESIYNTLGDKVIPLFFDRDDHGLPVKWINMMRNSIDLASNYTADKMLEKYKNELYKLY